MHVFTLKVSSLVIRFLTATFIGLLGMAIGVYLALTHASDVSFFILILIGLAGLVFLPDLLSNALTEWSISENEIKIKWLNQFLFAKKPDQNINWENIQEYTIQPDRQLCLLKLKLRDNTVLKYWHNNTAVDDDFEEFLSYFQDQVHYFNERGINILYSITRGKTKYETKSGIALALILAILMISFPILVLTLKPHKVDWIYIIPAYSAGIYFISQVISYKRKKKQQPT
jgi:hypothetical protein